MRTHAGVIKDIIASKIRVQQSLLLLGAPGVGKSDVVEEACEVVKYRLITMFPVLSDPTDCKGIAVYDGKTARFEPFDHLIQLCENGEKIVLLLDDLGHAPPAVQASFMHLVLARRVGSYNLGDLVTVVAASNRRQDRAGVSGILSPLVSRFSGTLTLEPHLDQWCAWAHGHGVHFEVPGFIRFRPEYLLVEPTAENLRDMHGHPCPRAHMFVSDNLFLKHYETGRPFDDNVIYALTSGICGEGYATEFNAYRKTHSRLPNIPAMLKNPKKCDIPKDPSIQYALSSALAYHATPTNMEACLIVGKRIGVEFSAMIVRDALARKQELKDCKAYRDWQLQNKEVLLYT